LLADDNDVRDVIIVCRDHISCIFDGLFNTNALGMPADGTSVISNVHKRMQELKVPLYLYHDI